MSALIETIGRWDFAAFQWLRAFHWALLDPLMVALSDIARAGTLWMGLAVMIALVYRSRWPAAVQVILAVSLTALFIDNVAKPLVGRERPYELHADVPVYANKPTTASFPSGHAGNAIAGAYALARLAPDARVIFWTLGFLVAFSRIYLGLHYPADIIGGALLGLGVAKFVIGGTRWRFRDERGRV
ncbi:MAG: phosphatase PAP2 family protein [Acidobacteria bacterium]|nr:MAG: phosphatase PAP2 family protein [Acidobacteriota bacterium]